MKLERTVYLTLACIQFIVIQYSEFDHDLVKLDITTVS